MIQSRSLQTLFALSLLSLSASCTGLHRTDLMDYREQTGFDVAPPRAGNALLIIVRPHGTAGAPSSSVFEDKQLIGVLMDGTYLAYETPPGQHRFMIIGNNVDFMTAELSADKVYFARIEARFPSRGQFGFHPVPPQDRKWRSVGDWLARAHRITLNESGRAWARDNAASINEKYDVRFPEWLQNPDRAQLRSEDGVIFRAMPIYE